MNQTAAGVRPHPPHISQDVVHTDDQTHRQQQPADPLARRQLDRRDALANQHRERVERPHSPYPTPAPT